MEFTATSVVIPLAAAAAALLFEMVSVGWMQCSARKFLKPGPELTQELLIFFLDILSFWRLVGHVLTFGVLYFFSTLLVPKPGAIPIALVQAAASLLAVDFLAYWTHRALHRIPLLWEIHKYHHGAEELSVVTAKRDSPLIAPLYVFAYSIPAAVLGVPTTEILSLSILLQLQSFLIHSEIRSNWGFLGRWVFISPLAHRYHHSSDRAHFGKNYGGLIVLWDRLFGTFYYPAANSDEIKLGVNANLLESTFPIRLRRRTAAKRPY